MNTARASFTAKYQSSLELSTVVLLQCFWKPTLVDLVMTSHDGFTPCTKKEFVSFPPLINLTEMFFFVRSCCSEPTSLRDDRE